MSDRRLLSLAALALALPLAACGSGSGGADDEASPPATAPSKAAPSQAASAKPAAKGKAEASVTYSGAASGTAGFATVECVTQGSALTHLLAYTDEINSGQAVLQINLPDDYITFAPASGDIFAGPDGTAASIQVDGDTMRFSQVLLLELDPRVQPEEKKKLYISGSATCQETARTGAIG